MNFKRISGLCNLVLVLAFLVHISGSPLLARITGTQPTSADIACWGPDGAEACVQDGGGLVPTTDNDAPLGTSSLRWSDVRSLDATFGDDVTVSDDLTVTDDANITGDLIKVPVSTITVAASDTISIAGACGGLVRLTTTDGASVTTDTTDTFTAPATANAGCILSLVNVGGGGAITLDINTNFAAVGYPSAGSIILNTNDSITVASTGNTWVKIGTISDN